MRVKYRKLKENARQPQYATYGDAGCDLFATSVEVKKDMNSFGEMKFVEYGTGLAVEIPQDHVGLVFPRSSVSDKTLALANSVGVIDSGYRGEIKARFRVTDTVRPMMYQMGDRVAQLVIVPFVRAEFEEVDELSDSERGEGGFGSTGSI